MSRPNSRKKLTRKPRLSAWVATLAEKQAELAGLPAPATEKPDPAISLIKGLQTEEECDLFHKALTKRDEMDYISFLKLRELVETLEPFLPLIEADMKSDDEDFNEFNGLIVECRCVIEARECANEEVMRAIAGIPAQPTLRVVK